MAEYDAGSAFVAILPSTRGFSQRLKREIAGVQADVAVPVRPELDRRQLSGLQAALKSLPAVVLDADATPADREIAGLRDRIERISSQRVGIDISAEQANREVDSIRSGLERLGRESPDIAVRVDAGAASAALEGITRETARLDGRTARATIDVDAGRALAGIGSVIAGLWTVSALSVRPHIDVDVSGVVSAISRVISMVLTLGGLAGTLGGIGGALGGVGAAGVVAGAGLGATMLASRGVGKALQALSAQQESATATGRQAAKQQAQQAQQVIAAQDRVAEASARVSQARSDSARNVSRAEADAEKSVDAARRQALSSLQAAQAAKESADRRAERSTRDLRMAQSQLTSAWETGRRSLQDLQDQLDSSLIDQRQAAVDLRDARKQLDEARASGDADAIERAQIAYDRQVESIDQLSKRTQRLGVDNQAAQQRGVAGTDAYRSALDRVAAAEEARGDAARSAGEAAANVDRARADGQRAIREAELAGQQRVDDAREQGARQVAAAQDAASDAQRALTQALAQTGDAGAATGDKVAAAFADLSPSAAAFARYLFGLQPILDGLSATAASRFFPPLQTGLDMLVSKAPQVSGMVGLLAGSMGSALGGVLTQLASPFWMGFFGLLAQASTTLIPGLFGSLMRLAGAVAILLVHLLPLAPAAFGFLDQVAALVVILAPFLAQLLGGLIPAASALLSALAPLGPVLGALQPLLLVLGGAFAQVLGAALRAVAPLLVALTPLIEHLAVQLATRLVAAIESLTPFLVGLAEWMSRNPSLVMGLVYAVLAAIPVFNLLGTIFSWLFGPVAILRLATMALGVSVGGLLAPVGGALAALGGLLNRMGAASAVMGVARSALSGVGSAMTWLIRSAVAALGPFGLLITVFSLLFATNEGFRAAVMGLIGVLAGLVGQVVSSLMPAVNSLLPVINIASGVFAGIASSLATALVPVVQLLADTLQWLSPILMPLLTIFLAVRGAMMLWAAAQWALNIAMAANPVTLVVLAILALVGAVVWAYQNVSWFRDLVDTVWSALQVAFSAIGAAATWLWVNVLSPVFSAIGLAARVLFAVVSTVLIVPLLIAWNLIAAAATWLWENALRPTFSAIGSFISWVWTAVLQPTFAALVWFWQSVIAPALSWLYNTIVLPIFNLIGAAIRFVWEWIIRPALQGLVAFWQLVLAPALSWLYNSIIKPIWDAVGAAIDWVWLNVIQPAFRAVVGGLDWLGQNFQRATDWIRDIWGRIRGFLAKPINFMIDVVWNKGVVPAWNKVAELVGLGQIQPLPLIPEMRTGGQIGAHVDSSGLIRGPGSGTSDSIMARVSESGNPLRVSNREFLVNADVTARALPFLTALNNKDGEALQAVGATRAGRGAGTFHGRSAIGLRTGGPVALADGVPGLAGGGAIERVGAATAWLSGEAQGIPYVWGGGSRSGMDCSGMQAAVTHILSGRSPYSGRIGTTASMPWGGFVPGLTSQYSIGNKPSDHMAGTLAGQNVEQHGPSGTPFSFPSRWGADNGYFPQKFSLPVVGGEFVSGGAGGGGFFNWILDKAQRAFDDLTNPAIDAMRSFVGEPPPEWRRVPPGLGTKMRDTVRDFVFGKAEEAGGAMGPPGEGAPFIVGQISDAARGAGVGKDGAIIGTATGLVETELRNLAGGDRDSVGVFQQRPSMGWGTVAECMNVLHAAMTFFSRFPRDWRSMPPGDVAQSVQRSAFPGKYATRIGQATGLVNQFGGVFDSGGGAIGRGIMFKDVIAREEVLDPVETEHGYRPLTRIAADLEAGRLAPPPGLSARDIAAMRPAPLAFPTEFELVGGELELVGDGIARIVDGRLRSVTQQLRTGRDT